MKNRTYLEANNRLITPSVPYPEPDKCSSLPLALISLTSILILFFQLQLLRLLSGPFSSDFTTKVFH
jgi:hypothetical protein